MSLSDCSLNRDAHQVDSEFMTKRRPIGCSLFGNAVISAFQAIRELIDLQLTPNADCLEVDRVARHHLGEVDKRLKQLRALKKELKDMIVSCAGGEVATCTIMESITKATR